LGQRLVVHRPRRQDAGADADVRTEGRQQGVRPDLQHPARRPLTEALAMFLDPQRFGFVAELEANWEAMRAEYLALGSDRFDRWVQRQMHGGGWTVFGLCALGQPIPGACASCPATARALEGVPGLSMAGFSRLAPHTHVKPHVGWAASVYRLHLALVVPEGC